MAHSSQRFPRFAVCTEQPCGGLSKRKQSTKQTRWTQTEDFKAVRWFDNYYYQQNHNWPIMAIKKDNFPQHGRWLMRNWMSESDLKLHSLTLTSTVAAKQRREHNKFALHMRGRLVCYWRRVYFADETMITDNFYDPKQKFIRGARFPKSASLPVRRGARPSKKLCCFALWYGQSMWGRVMEGILNSITSVSTIN